nr:exonuclease domain-containing protein [Vibrio agarilyticus]
MLVNTPQFQLHDAANVHPFLVLDFETTGLSPEDDEILSIGWVPLHQNKIDLSQAQHFLINDATGVRPETAVINHITPQMLASGVPLIQAMTSLFAAGKDKIWIAHACSVEKAFLDHFIARHFDITDVPIIWLDTLMIEKNMAHLRQEHDCDVSLAASRERYHLPPYHSHGALIDAVATAELFLAQCHRIEPARPISLAKAFRMSH